MIKNILIVQARVNSTRLKGKIFLKINKYLTFLDLLLIRLKKIRNIDKFIIAVPTKDKNFFKKINLHSFELYSGPERNVLKRYYNIVNKLKPKNIIRITSDCPFVDPKIISKVLRRHIHSSYEYLSTDSNTFPKGQDVEIFTFKSFKRLYKLTKKIVDKEHVTPLYYRSKKFKIFFYKYRKNFSDIRITLDYYSDFVYLKKIYKLLDKKYYFTLNDLLNVITKKKY